MSCEHNIQHLAIIMDGNGRWAQKNNLPRSAGHKAGTEAAKSIVTECRKKGIRYLTLYTFSRENWSRPKEEIDFLFDLLVRFLNRELKSLIEQSISLNILGDWEKLPFSVRKVLNHTRSKTAACQAMTLNLALNYSGREEILQAGKSLAAQGIAPEDIDEAKFREYLYTKSQPDPELIIRTSGEQRLSNYLLFQAAYSEFYFTSVTWPEFGKEELDKALADFKRRKRRFGGIE